MHALLTFFWSIWGFICSFKPAYLSRTPKWTFIDVHGLWIVSNVLIGSAFLSGGMPTGTSFPYVDRIFMASGSSTQSGLNTVDVNTLSTYQQIILYLVPIWTNPIMINTFVVALRLWWFQRRMKSVVAAARNSRRTIGRTFSRARTRDLADEEGGYHGRRIVVMHENTRPGTVTSDFDSADLALYRIPSSGGEEVKDSQANASESSAHSGESRKDSKDEKMDEDQEQGHPLRPQITFADQPKPVHAHTSVDMARGKGPHFLSPRKDLRNPDEVLRIPSPRDAEKGMVPQAVDESDRLTRPLSRGGSAYSRASAPEQDTMTNAPTLPRRGITIADAPNRLSTEETASADADEKQSWLRTPSWLKRRKGSEDSGNGSELRPIRSRISTFASYFKSNPDAQNMPYLSWDPTIGRNSAFVDLTEDQREELGGIEYRSLKLLFYILIGYFFGFTIFGIVGLAPWIMQNEDHGRGVVNAAGQGRPWWAIYTSSSAFNDVGFTLTPDSMVSFSTAKWPLVLLSYLIVIGNTGFPVMLRVTIWFFSKIVPKESSVYEELRFLLDHPRRCFTLLFPSRETWTLFGILILLNGLDLILYVVLDLNTKTVIDDPVSIRILNGWFQAVSTRTAGFTVIDLSTLHPSVQISYLIMMYISIFPIAISVRRTNVYEERSLGVYQNPDEEPEGNPSYISSHIRRQLSYDLWYIFLGFFVISIVEGQRLGDDSEPRFSMFALLFEIVSAYGTVGLSLGYPGRNQSFSVVLKPLSKLVIVAMQIRGRHRGLPYALDRAILLPSERRLQEEEDMAAARMPRRMSMASVAGSATGHSIQRTRSRSSERGRPSTSGISLFNSFLGPGPAMPVHRRPTINKDDTVRTPNPTRRRHSVGTTGQRARRESMDTETSRIPFLTNLFSSSSNMPDKQAPPKPEGRRSFFQEGINPQPSSPTTLPPSKVEGKQA